MMMNNKNFIHGMYWDHMADLRENYSSVIEVEEIERGEIKGSNVLNK